MSSTILCEESAVRGAVSSAEQIIKGVVNMGISIQEGYDISVTFNDDGTQTIAITSPMQEFHNNE